MWRYYDAKALHWFDPFLVIRMSALCIAEGPWNLYIRPKHAYILFS
jgi:hypothetical protein